MNAMNLRENESMEGRSVGARTEQIKTYLRRLGEGEELERVRADFVRDFAEVEASEIMQAEQELLKEGTPLNEVQKLCDVHAALFHGSTREEKIARAEKAVADSLQQASSLPLTRAASLPAAQQGAQAADYSAKGEKAAALAALPGHPLQTLSRENEALSALLEEMKPLLEHPDTEKTKEAAQAEWAEKLAKIRELAIHYAKKGDLLYPHLKVRFAISGPSDVMWTVDDEIRDELARLVRETVRDASWLSRLSKVLQRAGDMIYKEKNILFPICAVNFTDREWQQIYHDAKDYAPCFGIEPEIWEKAEAWKRTGMSETAATSPAAKGSETGGLSEVSEAANAASGSAAKREIVMPGGHMTLPQLTALLNTIPLEITFIDDNNINRFFNEGPKVFKRPTMAIDREVFSCHPPKIEPMVRAILEDLRTGKRDRVPVWMEKGGRTMLVTYMAVRDSAQHYLGTMEIVQDMEFAKEHFRQQN